MTSNVSNAQGAALWTLAHNLGHEWAGYTTAEEMLSDGWDAVAARVNAEMGASYEEYSDARSSLPAGLWPATGHTTGSGRLSWYCRSYGDAVVIEVNRPAPGLSGSNSVVLRLSAQLTPDGWILAGCESIPSMIELRHIQAISYSLYESEDACYVHHILGIVDDQDLAERLEPEIVVAQAALLAYQAEEQARIDAYLTAEQDRLEA